MHDMALAMRLSIQIANPNHDAWRWKNVKRKTDKDDALKLAQLSAMNQLPALQLPGSDTTANRIRPGINRIACRQYSGERATSPNSRTLVGGSRTLGHYFR